jgi:hypothetical protein
MLLQFVALLDTDDVVNKCLEFHIRKGKCYNWTDGIKDELRNMGLAYVSE